MIPFNRPSYGAAELSKVAEALASGHTSGNGRFTKEAEAVLGRMHVGSSVLLTTSCTHALEMSARLLDLQPGDEVIVPAYTFVSTANSFLWNGAKPVFADIDLETMNIDLESVRSLVSKKTKAICVVHYAGIGAEPEQFAQFAADHGLILIEDNAHGLGATWNARPLGTFGAISTLSFHETKNISCGEGGAIVLNDARLLERAEILREKGTDRSRFVRGQVGKYTWLDAGSSWVLSDLLAAVLLGQLERFSEIRGRRETLWFTYNELLAEWASANGIKQPRVPDQARHTGHLYYIRLPDERARDRFVEHMRTNEVQVTFHYQALNRSPYGRNLSVPVSVCPSSEMATKTLVRLPLYERLTDIEHSRVIDAVSRFSN